MNFRKLTVSLFALAFCCIVLNKKDISANSITELKNKQNQIEEKEKEAKKQLDAIRGQKKTLANEISALDIEISLAEDQLQFIGDRLSAVTIEHEVTTEELKVAEEEKDDYYISLKKRLKYIHENGKIGYYQVLFNSKSFGDFLNRVEYVNDIIAYDQKMYAGLKDIEETINTKKIQIEEQLAEIEVLFVQQEDKIQDLEQVKTAKDTLMAETVSNEERQQELIETLENESNDLANKIRQAQEEADRKARAAAAAAAAAAERNSSVRLPASSGSGASPSGQFTWPIPGYYKVSSGFINRTNPVTGKKEFHTGIDLPAPRGTTTVAAEAGTVIMAGTNGGYGLCVVIDHGNGVSTLYAHHSALSVSVGQSVSRGQAIGSCGSTGISTGNHLHFEVRINGSPVNPGPYVY